MMHELHIQPRDVLFFRDGRPIGASDAGHGADWPLPSTFHEAMLTAFHDTWPDRQPWEYRHRNRRDKSPGESWDQNWQTSSLRFGGLQTAGPFPHRDGRMHVPLPADLEAGENGRPTSMRLQAAGNGDSNLPRPLTMAVGPAAPPSKETLGAWIRLDHFSAYLKGQVPDRTVPSDDLFASESRPGIALDPGTGTTEEGRFYAAEYLRLKDDVSLSAFATCPTVHHDPTDGRTTHDAVAEFLESGVRSFVFGGQRGVVRIINRRQKPESERAFGQHPQDLKLSTCVKWVLLTPAVFAQGWIPGFVNPETGRVEIRDPSQAARRSGEKRRDWRKRLRDLPPIRATLAAARVPKARTFSGWVQPTERNSQAGGGKKSGPKKTYRAVPAGAVYYFRTGSDDDARLLAGALNGARRSDFFGEKGFGMGVCGTWSHQDSTAE